VSCRQPQCAAIARERRGGSLQIAGIGESHVEPIRNPVTGEEHRARIVLPEGFEYQEAEMANTASWRITASELATEHQNTYAHLNAFDWTARPLADAAVTVGGKLVHCSSGQLLVTTRLGDALKERRPGFGSVWPLGAPGVRLGTAAGCQMRGREVFAAWRRS